MAGSTIDAAKTSSKGRELMSVMWSMTTLATLLVVTRLCVRQRMLRNFGFDDWLIGASMVIIPAILPLSSTSRSTYLTYEGTPDLRFDFCCDSDNLCGVWIWTTYGQPWDTGRGERPPVDHDLIHLRNHIIRVTKARRCRSAPSNHEPNLHSTHHNVGSSHPGGCHCHCQHLDLYYHVQSTTGTLEELNGIERGGHVQGYFDSYRLCYVQRRWVEFNKSANSDWWISVISDLRICRPLSRNLSRDHPVQTSNVITQKDRIGCCAWPGLDVRTTDIHPISWHLKP